MKRISLILSIAAMAASAAPLAAQSGGKYDPNQRGVYDTNRDGVIDNRDRAVTQGCAWYDVNCNGVNTRNNRNTTTGWQLIGRDLDGNSIYERRTYERNGKATVETARRLSNGRMQVIDKRKVDNRYSRRDDRNNNGVDDRYERVRGR
jgi:hypothetical protein